jgi:hypothetical protein
MSTEKPPIGPFENGAGDRDHKGQFVKGWRGGPGSPKAKYARKLRARLNEALHEMCTPDRLKTVVDAMLKEAEAGNVAAAKFIFERLDGTPVQKDFLSDIDEIRGTLEQMRRTGNINFSGGRNG